jgi:transcriptional regulator with XRE-family HTH domain
MSRDSELARAVEEETFHADIAAQIIKLRTEAKMSQKDLAIRVNTQQSVISRIEDADYSGHSLSLLLRIAHVFGKRLHLNFVDEPSAVRGKSNGRKHRSSA